ncbi:MAG: hypothetical protein KME60_13705 [Cyanomargarita calcarea GSE-NOS-MK-12-04C]|jgi:hypothetical protein|uniref:Uncharacterized protein n=1 Tax=Cyanomargarita calcarea GSE-NOS-MK-12-04C TaxID=2839659 RepID=A0A951US82_9CYAN|nr:hypothetical protein [Cyanomargarita calcarea GSE-NOS-MK-12-04C]
MSTYKSKFHIFRELFQEKPELFSDCQKEVEALIDELKVNSDLEIVEKRLLEWLNLPSHSKIFTAFKNRLSAPPEDTKGVANSQSYTPVDEPSSVAQHTLDNAIISTPEGVGDTKF